MKIKSFGCSFIFGSERSDDGKNGWAYTGSQLTWPALLAQHFGYEYHSYARPGAGNLQIAERLLNELVDQEKNLYVIGWTWIDRFDYIDNYSTSATIWPGTAWATIRPQDEEELSQVYYKNLHSEYRDKLTTLMLIRLTIDILKSKNLPFIMTYVDDLMLDQEWHTTPAVEELQDYIRPYLTTFDGISFLNWTRSQKYSETKQGHPLEEAHRAAADYIIKVFDKKNTNAH